MKTHAQAVIIGGGVVGCSIAYHLAKSGWTDVVLLERSELTAGSTWHAAGGTGAFAGGVNTTELAKYAFSLYPELEKETGQSCGFHHTGLVTLARSDERLDELRRHHAAGRRHSLETEWLSPDEALEKAPILNMESIKAVLFEPYNGHVDPSGVTQAFAKGARDRGVEILRHCPVTALTPRADGGWTVETEKGSIQADHVVNAAGLWGREVGAMAGIDLPMMPVEHHYFVTDNIPEVEALKSELPLIGDADAEYYMRQEVNGLLLGVYEDTCTHWAVDGTPPDFGHELLPDALERIERNLMQACESVPVLGEAGVKRVINGPIMFSPDLNPLIGPYPGLPTYWCACGVMSGFSQAAGIGLVLAEWMTNGEAPLDVFMWDVARYGAWADKAFTKSRTANMYSTRFTTLYPYEEREAGRPVRTRPGHATFERERAFLGQSDGWEFPLWYAPAGVEPKDSLTFRRPNWFKHVRDECLALHNGVGLIDISTYARHQVSGPGAEKWLDGILTNRLPGVGGKVTLTAMLSETGKLMGDFSVTRTGPETFLLVGSGVVDRFHHRWWNRFLPADGVTVESLTNRTCAVSVSGPNARRLLERLADADLSNGAFPYRSVVECALGPIQKALVMRIAYTGELGFEIIVDESDHETLLNTLLETGADLDARMVGVRGLNSLRVEKGFGAWGLELSPDYTPYEAGLDAFVKLDKGGFVGQRAAASLKEQPKRYHAHCFSIDTDEVDPWGDEPLLHDGQVVGFLSSAAYGHRVNQSLGLGYLKSGFADQREGIHIDLLGEMRGVTVLDRPAFDPTGARMRD